MSAKKVIDGRDGLSWTHLDDPADYTRNIRKGSGIPGAEICGIQQECSRENQDNAPKRFGDVQEGALGGSKAKAYNDKRNLL